MRWAIGCLARMLVWACARAYGAEGINIPLSVMPGWLVSRTLRTYGARIGADVRMQSPVVVHNAASSPGELYGHLTIGDHCYLGRLLFLDLADRITVEDYVTLSHRVMILTHTDAGPSPLRDAEIPTSQAPVVIRRGAYIGAAVTILQGVEIGEQAVVGAGALVNRSVPPRTVVAGVPARVIREITADGARNAVVVDASGAIA